MNNSLSHYDLNLLKCMHVLFQERSVKAAAEKLHQTPSAMSKSLKRLREEFDDPLFIRGTHCLIPTQRAEQLAIDLSVLFEAVENCYSHKTFNPLEARGHIQISAPEQFSLLLIPKLLKRLRRKAPNIIIESHHLEHNYLDLLSSGSNDFTVYLEQPHPKEFYSTCIYSPMPAYWGRKDHPLSKKKNKDISLSDLLHYPQIAFHYQNISQHDMRIMQDEIKQEGITPKVILDTGHLLTALDVLMDCDALMMAPDYSSMSPLIKSNFKSFSVNHLKIFDHLQINISLLQHRKTLKSPLHSWVSNQIKDIFYKEIGAAALTN